MSLTLTEHCLHQTDTLAGRMSMIYLDHKVLLFLISRQHLKIQRFYAQIQISRFSWKKHEGVILDMYVFYTATIS